MYKIYIFLKDIYISIPTTLQYLSLFYIKKLYCYTLYIYKNKKIILSSSIFLCNIKRVMSL